MQIHIYKDTQAIGAAAAALFAAQVIQKPTSVLGLATGSTPIPAYAKMAELYACGAVDYSSVPTDNLDEYVGLDHSHPQSYYSFMMEHLFSHINVPAGSIHVLSGTAPDPEAECAAYEKAIEAAGGIDLQILGIGRNGHIAFNEPDTSFAPATHVVNLTQSTIEANTRFFSCSDEVPRQALTMGIGSIMKARSIVLIATGADKADAVRALVNGAVSPACPASVLQLHPRVTVMLDAPAASLL